uniref:Hexosyltransferase n=1 Tax=Alexandrium catenella TaxID=2925 RepID=A0A7S1KYZ7_ALECA|mmetsp:Transcript_103259/g.274618  ORF Transcript_103259/g.274618 Transcript_103259/m.274618 type:complete len:423 (+) Transcript_103259:52-1320(+)
MRPHSLQVLLLSCLLAVGALRHREASRQAGFLERERWDPAAGNTTEHTSPVCTLRPPPPPVEENSPFAMHRLAPGTDTSGNMVMEMPSSGDSSMGVFAVSDMNAAAEVVRARSKHLAQEVFNTTRAFVTLATLCQSSQLREKQAYFLMHTLTLARSLREVNSTYPLIVLVSDQQDCDLLLEYQGRVLQELNVAFMRVPAHFFRPEALPEPMVVNWRYTYPKSYVWAMDGFERLVYLDADVMMLRNSDDLFDLPDPGHLYMSTNQRACDKQPFEANDLGAASNLMVLSPQYSAFRGLLEEFKGVRRHKLWEEGEADDQSIIRQHFKDLHLLKQLPQADMLFTECLRLYNCEVTAVRALHFGNAGRLVLDQGGFPIRLDLDHNWKPVFNKWAELCRSTEVKKACNGHCVGLCLSRHRTWDCKNC